jgi:glycosyltransferase involved in cell wall biosynthesis
MSGDMVIDADELDGRLRARPGRSLRLLYSGRYEKIKGADDVVRVAATCLRRGIDIELHCYGQGSLRESMKLLAGDYPDHIHVHDALPFATLVEKSKSFDAFVCCHIQNDPSCTYLEAFGCGLPVIGYANRMWKKLCDVSKAGMVSRMHDIASLANNIAYISHEFEFLAACSHRARAFALGHTFELEFAKRTSSLNEALAGKRVR